VCRIPERSCALPQLCTHIRSLFLHFFFTCYSYYLTTTTTITSMPRESEPVFPQPCGAFALGLRFAPTTIHVKQPSLGDVMHVIPVADVAQFPAGTRFTNRQRNPTMTLCDAYDHARGSTSCAEGRDCPHLHATMTRAHTCCPHVASAADDYRRLPAGRSLQLLIKTACGTSVEQSREIASSHVLVTKAVEDARDLSVMLVECRRFRMSGRCDYGAACAFVHVAEAPIVGPVQREMHASRTMSLLLSECGDAFFDARSATPVCFDICEHSGLTGCPLHSLEASNTTAPPIAGAGGRSPPETASLSISPDSHAGRRPFQHNPYNARPRSFHART
jgi:hypothetical protein